MTLDPWRIATIEHWLHGLHHEAQLLELGAGTGQMAEHVGGLGYQVAAIDLSPGNVAAMVARGVAATEADFADLPFSDGSFHGAFAFNSLLHVPRVELPGVYEEVRRVLVTDAPLLVVVWGGEDSSGPYADDWLDPPRYFNFFSDEAMWNQATPGFEKVALEVIEGATSTDLTARAFTLIAT